MQVECPNCKQIVEIDKTLAGSTIECPSCQQPFAIPFAPPPPMHVPLQPGAPSASVSKRKRKGLGCGCDTFFLLFILIGAGAFGYAMYRFQESPRQVWSRLTTAIERYT